MRALAKCPICGHENERICFTEWGIGVVEDYYTCRKCSYAEKMAYSPYLIAVRKGYPKKYKNKVKERDIKVLSLSNLRKRIRFLHLRHATACDCPAARLPGLSLSSQWV